MNEAMEMLDRGKPSKKGLFPALPTTLGSPTIKPAALHIPTATAAPVFFFFEHKIKATCGW